MGRYSCRRNTTWGMIAAMTCCGGLWVCEALGCASAYGFGTTSDSQVHVPIAQHLAAHKCIIMGGQSSVDCTCQTSSLACSEACGHAALWGTTYVGLQTTQLIVIVMQWQAATGPIRRICFSTKAGTCACPPNNKQAIHGVLRCTAAQTHCFMAT